MNKLESPEDQDQPEAATAPLAKKLNPALLLARYIASASHLRQKLVSILSRQKARKRK